jgi:hypothetical protein
MGQPLDRKAELHHSGAFRFTKGKICNIADKSVNKGITMLHISVSKCRHEIRIRPRLDEPQDPRAATRSPQESRMQNGYLHPMPLE